MPQTSSPILIANRIWRAAIIACFGISGVLHPQANGQSVLPSPELSRLGWQLTMAIAHHDLDAAKAALESGASANTGAMGLDRPPLLQVGDNVDLAELLLSHGADPNAKGGAPLMQAAAGAVHVAQLLIERGADVKLPDGATLLFQAAVNKDIAALFLLHGATFPKPSSRDSLPEPVQKLFASVVTQDIAGVERAISSGADVNAITRDDLTPLIFAARSGDTSIANILVLAGADLRASTPTTKITPFSAARTREMIEFLLGNGATPTEQQLQAALDSAIPYNIDLAAAIIRHGGDVNKFDERGWNTLNSAAGSGILEAVKFLLSHGAKADLANRFGLNALQQTLKFTGMNANPDVLNVLAEAGARLSTIGLSDGRAMFKVSADPYEHGGSAWIVSKRTAYSVPCESNDRGTLEVVMLVATEGFQTIETDVRALLPLITNQTRAACPSVAKCPPTSANAGPGASDIRSCDTIRNSPIEFRAVSASYIDAPSLGNPFISATTVRIGENQGGDQIANWSPANSQEIRARTERETRRIVQLEEERKLKREAQAKVERRNAFIQQFNVAKFVSLDELRGNPYIYKGQVVALLTSLERMVSENEALFLQFGLVSSPGLYVFDVPSTKFRPNQQIVLAFQVIGVNRQFMLPSGKYVGEYWCQQGDCREFFGN